MNVHRNNKFRSNTITINYQQATNNNIKPNVFKVSSSIVGRTSFVKCVKCRPLFDFAFPAEIVLCGPFSALRWFWVFPANNKNN